MGAPATLAWWQWPTNRRRLELWTKSLCPRRCQSVTLDPTAGTAWCDVTTRTIAANPEWDDQAPPRRQWALTKCLLAHEAGHARFTDPDPDGTGGVLHKLRGILEDERIERAMAQLFAHLEDFFRLGGAYSWGKAPPVQDEDDPWEIIWACLLWRWEGECSNLGTRIAFPSGSLNAHRWARARPLVEEAWVAPDTTAVLDIARRILADLGLPESTPLPDWLRDLLDQIGQAVQGERPAGNPAEPLPGRASPGQTGRAGAAGQSPPGGSTQEPPEEDPEEPDPAENRAGGLIEPAPFEVLEREMLPAARLLVEGLSIREQQAAREWVPHGGRYSVRADMRTDGARPFVAPDAPGLAPPKHLAIQLLLDRTGSMASHSNPQDPWSKDQAAKRAAMMLYLACGELHIPLAIMAFRDNIPIQEFGQWSPMVQALLAGFHGYGEGAFLCRAIRARRAVLEARPEATKLLLVVHDGLPECPEDERHLADLVREVHQPARGVYVLGLYLGQNPYEIAGMRTYFDQRLLVCSHMERLPDMLCNQVRSWRGRG